jgi:hypothetical protein
MPIMTAKRAGCCLAVVMALLAPAVWAEAPIGQVKTETGSVTVERSGVSKPLAIGDHVFRSDTIVTGRGTVGITFIDNSMMSLGPMTRLSLDKFEFDATTHKGVFDASLKKGTLAVKSGQIVRQTPEAMRIRTPAALLGVRGTEFAVSVDETGR